jgi:hypothetical protein
VEVARSLGISVKRLNGWEPKRTTKYHYSHNRLSEATTTVEPEWDDDERNWMLALADLEAQSCSGCNGWLPDTTGIEKDGAFEAPPPRRCHRCNALAERRRQVRESKTVNLPEALTVWPIHEVEKGG